MTDTGLRLTRWMPRRVTLRARLTLIYGGLFLAFGVVLLGTTYALFNQRLTSSGPELSVSSSVEPDATAADPPVLGTTVVTDDGDVLTGDSAASWLRDEQSKLHDSATASLITQGGIALGVVGGAAAGFGWLMAGRVLAPLRQVTATARRIAAAPAADKGLHERIALRGPDDEVKDLADSFDTMVERLDRSFDGQRRFVANASHELRTPLTLSRALVELAMRREPASEDVKRLGENLLEINARHDRLISGLLLLAGADNVIPEKAPVDLADVVAHVVALVGPEAERAGVTVEEDPGEAVTPGDALLLERLVHNLVENGIRHNVADDGWVRATSRTVDESDRVRVVVTNSGPVVPPYEIPALFEPFRRLGTDRITANGAGLGLSIVRSVARAHGGEVTARPREGGGLEVTVTLPRYRDAELATASGEAASEPIRA